MMPPGGGSSTSVSTAPPSTPARSASISSWVRMSLMAACIPSLHDEAGEINRVGARTADVVLQHALDFGQGGGLQLLLALHVGKALHVLRRKKHQQRIADFRLGFLRGGDSFRIVRHDVHPNLQET